MKGQSVLVRILIIVSCLLFSSNFSFAQDSCTSSSENCESCNIPPSPSNPGGDHPDETFAVDSGNPPLEPYFTSDPHAVVLMSGFDNEFNNMLYKMKKSSTKTDLQSAVSELLNSSNALVIPSGGLYGQEGSAFLRIMLDEFVKQGGTLVVFAQQHGYEFNLLPVPTENDGTRKNISGFGWGEDQSCFTNGTYIDTWHQILSGQIRSTPSLNVDGYFTSYPSNTTVLLRRTANGQPALITYEYGQGRVIASSMYSDWAFSHSQASSEELALIRDMIAWAKNPAQLPETLPGGSVSLSLEMVNLSETVAAKANILTLNPGMNLVQTQTVDITMSAGETASIPYSYTSSTTSPVGIWHAAYELLDADGSVIQPRTETDSGRFVVSNPPDNPYESADFNFAVNSDSEYYLMGSQAVFTVTAWNNTDTDATLTYNYTLAHLAAGGTWGKDSHEFTAPANSSTSFTIIIPEVLHQGWVWGTFNDSSGAIVGNARKGIWVSYPSVDVDLETNKVLYERGESVNLAIGLHNRIGLPSSGILKVKILNPLNAIAYSETIDINLSGYETTSRNISYVIPQSAEGGYYIVTTEIFNSNGKKIGGDSASFELPQSQINVDVQLPQTFKSGDNDVLFTMENAGGIPVSSGNIHIEMTSPSGALLHTGDTPFALEIGANVSFNINVPLGDLEYGDYHLSYTVSDETRTKSDVITIPNEVKITSITFDKPSYHIREDIGLTVSLVNAGQYENENLSLIVEALAVSYETTGTIALGASQGQISQDYTISIPATVSVGSYEINVMVLFPGGGSVSRTATFVIPQSDLKVTFDGDILNAGDIITVPLENRGGVDTQGDYSIKLFDARNYQIAETASTQNINAGEIYGVQLQTPLDLVNGTYFLRATYTDMSTQVERYFVRELNATGVDASLAVITDKEVYLSSENINALAHIGEVSLPTFDGILNLKVITEVKPNSSLSGYAWWNPGWNYRVPVVVNSGTIEQTDRPAEIRLNFTSLLGSMGQAGTLDVNSIRVTEHDSDGNFVQEVPSQFNPDDGFNPSLNASGSVAWILDGQTSSDTIRHYVIYFDIAENGLKPEPWYETTDAVLDNTAKEFKTDSIYMKWGGRGYNSSRTDIITVLKFDDNGNGDPTDDLDRLSDYGYYYGFIGTTTATPGGFGSANGAIISQGPIYVEMKLGSARIRYYNGVTNWFEGNGVVNHVRYFGSAWNFIRAKILDENSITGGSNFFTYYNSTEQPGYIAYRNSSKGLIFGVIGRDVEKYVTHNKRSPAYDRDIFLGDNADLPDSRIFWYSDNTGTYDSIDALSTSALNPPITQAGLVEEQPKYEELDGQYILWQKDVPVSVDGGIDLTEVVGQLSGVEGKLYLLGTLKTGNGQVITDDSYPFYVVDSDFVVTLDSDKDAYKPGESIELTGKVLNLSSIDAVGFSLKVSLNDSNIHTETFDLAAGTTYSFAVSTVAGVEGPYKLSALVTQNASEVASLTDVINVFDPSVLIDISAPEVAGNEPFDLAITLQNEGNVDANINMQSSVTNETISIPVGESRTLQYSQQIVTTTDFTFAFSGDIAQVITKTVSYGLNASLSVEPQSIYPEGIVGIPFTVSNTGQLPENLTVGINLEPADFNETRTYFIPVGESTSDVLYVELSNGDYTITAQIENPDVTSTASFSIREKNMAEMVLAIGAQSEEIIPASASITNIGYNLIEGSVRASLINGEGNTIWKTEKTITGIQPSITQAVVFAIHSSTLKRGGYSLYVTLFDNSNNAIASESVPLVIQGPVFEITHLPEYQTYSPGEDVEMIFTVKNTGDVEGLFELNLSAYDLIDSTQSEWIKPGEEKTLNFSFTLPVDLEEKDYFADFKLAGADGSLITSGQLRYHLAGISITVAASLNKQNYAEGETAHLLLQVQSSSSLSLPLFARVNYAGYDSEFEFTLDGSQTLTFDVSLPEITGEKLFYGIYHESGRSIHLNSLYIYETDEELSIVTDKQVYNPSEPVLVTVSSAVGGGVLNLEVFDYFNSSDFSGVTTESFVIPQFIKAGTYTITAKLVQNDGTIYKSSHSIDITGVQAKVLDCKNDKDKYTADDVISTDFVIASNSDLTATIKTWILYPDGYYKFNGEYATALLSNNNLTPSIKTEFSTAISGIHKLVYGIYSNNVLLASGSEAFDVGDAVLLGISADKQDYPTVTEPVMVTVSMLGTVEADIQIKVDGEVVKGESVSLNGFTNITIELDDISPGIHTLQGILISGGLQSTKETTFSFGSDLPDLTVLGHVNSSEVSHENKINIGFTLKNEGKTASAQSVMAVYKGDDLLENVAVSVLEPGEEAQVNYSLDVLGDAGTLVVKGIADNEHAVLEFREDNNTASITVAVPESVLFISTDSDKYRVGQNAHITATVHNLSAVDQSGYSLRTLITSDSEEAAFDSTEGLEIIPAKSLSDVPTVWNIPVETVEGSYTIRQYLVNNDGEVKASSSASIQVLASDFSIALDREADRVKQGEDVIFKGNVDPVGYFDSTVMLSVIGVPPGASLVFGPESFVPPGEASFKILTSGSTDPGTYEITISAEGDGIIHEVSLTLDIEAFEVSLDKTASELLQLESDTFTISANSLNGYEGTVNLEIQGVPFGMNAKLDDSSIEVQGDTELTIQTSKYLSPGEYILTVRADDSLAEHTQDITVTVQANPAIAAGLILTEGPGPKNEAWVRVMNASIEPVLDFLAFDTSYGANAVSADLDGDGYDEIVVSQGPDPKNKAMFRVFSKNGVLLSELSGFDAKYGMTLSSGDLDGDWKDELVIGMGPDPKNPAALKVLKFNGYGFDELLNLNAYEGYKYGVNMALGDLDGDHQLEIIAAPGPGPKNPAVIGIWDQRGGSLEVLNEFIAFDGMYGANVAAGDIDGDGNAEIMVGSGPDPKNAPVVRVFEADGSMVMELAPYEGKYGYGAYVTAVDLDDDGVKEIVTGLGPDPKSPAWVKAFRADGTEIAEFLAYPESTKYGVKVSEGRPGTGY